MLKRFPFIFLPITFYPNRFQTSPASGCQNVYFNTKTIVLFVVLPLYSFQFCQKDTYHHSVDPSYPSTRHYPTQLLKVRRLSKSTEKGPQARIAAGVRRETNQSCGTILVCCCSIPSGLLVLAYNIRLRSSPMKVVVD